MVDFKIIAVLMLFVILISIQFTLNRIYVELKEIRKRMDYRTKEDTTAEEADRRYL